MKHVLLIDDNSIDNYITKSIISKSNLAQKISVIDSAIKALEYLAKLKNYPDDFPDVILLDVQMPEMDGFAFLEQFSQFPNEIIDSCRIYMLSSSNDKYDTERALQFSVVKKYFNKPFRTEMLDDI